jgi:hypothetical protein
VSSALAGGGRRAVLARTFHLPSCPFLHPGPFAGPRHGLNALEQCDEAAWRRSGPWLPGRTPVAALPSSRCAAARPQALQASRASAGSHGPQAGATPELPPSKGGAGSKGAVAHSQQQRRVAVQQQQT